MVIAVPLVVLTIALGVFPQTLLLSWMSPSVDRDGPLGHDRAAGCPQASGATDADDPPRSSPPPARSSAGPAGVRP